MEQLVACFHSFLKSFTEYATKRKREVLEPKHASNVQLSSEYTKSVRKEIEETKKLP